MYELIQVGEHTYYIDCPAKMGVYQTSPTEAILIDSGNDKDAAKKVLKIFDQQGWKLTMVINTHSHADHIGGNAMLQQRTGCMVYGPAMESGTIKDPIYEPSLLYGGYPFKELRNKFLMAQPTEKFLTLDEQGMAHGKKVLPEGMEIISLPGHAMNMIGVKTPDDVWFMADCVSSPAVLSKYHVNFTYDVAEYLKTLEKIESMTAKLLVPSHTQPVESMEELVKLNREKVFEIKALLLEICGEFIAFDDILAKVFDHFGLVMDFSQNVLVGSTIRSYLSWLKDGGLMTADIQNNRLVWKTV